MSLLKQSRFNDAFQPKGFLPRARQGMPRQVAASIAVREAQSVNKSAYDHVLPDRMRLEMVRMNQVHSNNNSKNNIDSASSSDPPPLLFVHGSYHGAWCWEEKFMPYFAERGYDTYALSLRAQGGSERGNLQVAGTLESHAKDVASVISTLPRPPIVVGHSFGGLLVQKYLALSHQGSVPAVAGCAFLCSVPPSGNKDIVTRIASTSIPKALKITWAFVTKSFARSIDSCKETFFSNDIPEEDLICYQAKLAACSPVKLLDLRTLNSQLPLTFPVDPSTANLKIYVAGGETDLVVDPPAVEELATFFGVKAHIFPQVAHDCMLDTRWEEVASGFADWIEESFGSQAS